MAEGPPAGIGRTAFAGWLGAIVVLVAAQSAVHLAVVLGTGRVNTLVDLDRSNGIPDLVSTAALAAAAAGAACIPEARATAGRVVARALAVLLTLLTLADLLHDGAHTRSTRGWLVIGVVVVVGVLLVALGIDSGRRIRITLVVAGCVLVLSLLVNGLDRLDHWFERERGDPIAEYQIVAKEGLELLGWSLVALALWDEALRRRHAVAATTASASRARAASRRRAA
jgi:hypothetical protein